MTTADLPDTIARRVLVLPTGCWLWRGCRDRSYGKVRHSGKMWRVHRLTYTLLVGPIPDGLQCDHLCRVEICCNPRHLELVTNRENSLRIPYPNPGQSVAAAIMRARTHCPRGHAYTERNTGTTKQGSRICRACARDRMRLTRALRREALALPERAAA